MRIQVPVRVRTPAIALFLNLAAATSALAQSGSISGRVTARASGAPLGDVRVTIVGSTQSATTNADGRYAIRGLRAGTITLRALRLGYEESKRIVTIPPDAEATMDFVLNQAVQNLPGVVTTATGQERRIEVGNSIGSIEAADRVKTTPIHNMADLLVAKAPGLTVIPGAMSGASQTIRIRGLNSLDRSNAPIFVVDGIRVDGGNGGIVVGGTTSSRLNDITPEEIENIEVVRGPSAATLYGTNAANGVIVITTKKGRAGKARWNWSSEYGVIEDHNPYPKSYAIWGRATTTPPGGTAIRCTLVTLGQGTCIRDSVTSAHMLRKDGITPIGTGSRQLHTMQVSGGSELVRYFVSGTLEGEDGAIKMPQVDRERLTAQLINLREEWTDPERLDRASFRANMNAAISPQFDLNVSTMFLRSEQRLPQVDNNVNSFYFQALTNPGFHPGPNCSTATPCLNYTNVSAPPQNHPLNGWAQFTPADMFQRTRSEGVKRFVGGTTASWRPLSWLQTDGTIGIDFYSERAFQLCRLNECANFGTQRLGSVLDNHFIRRILTANLRGSARHQLTPDLNLKAVLGGDYNNDQSEASNASSTILPPGAQTVGAGAVPSASNTPPTATKTLGYYIQGEAAYRDRLWLTAAIRQDENTAFGTNESSVLYPKLSASWAASEESFFPRIPGIDALRLRAAYGASGVQPNPLDPLRTFNPVTVSIFSDQPALLAGRIGNPNLKPELTKEFETGFDIDGWGRRARLEATYYSKVTQDALVNQNIAASSGAPVTFVTRNLGKVKNAGVEGLLTVRALDMEQAGLDVTLSYSHNDNKVVTLGPGIPTIGTTTRIQPGFPINSYFLIRYAYSDANNDGLIVPAELTINPLDTAFVGPAFAPNSAAIQLGLDLLRRQLRVNAGFDHRSGHAQLTNTHSFLCGQSLSHEEVSNPETPIARQARCVAARVGVTQGGVNTRTNIGFYERGAFWRFRELSLTYDLPEQVTRKYVRYAQNLSLSLGARNLKVWTDYTGEDPEANYSTTDVPSTLLTTAPRRYYTARLNVAF
jgi:TonB-linked SusC/RagA family outer membrane protein